MKARPTVPTSSSRRASGSPRLEPSVFPKRSIVRSSVDKESPVFVTCRTRRLRLHVLLPARLSRRSLSISILRDEPPPPPPSLAVNDGPEKTPAVFNDDDHEDEKIVHAVVAGKMPSYDLESKLGDCLRAAGVRREVLRRTTGRAMKGLPLDGFDYASILGQCCEMPIGYVQLPVGVAGPLVLDGREYFLPMTTTEGCLVASTNRGCKAIGVAGGASSMVLRDGMTRAPAMRFATAGRAAELKFFLEDPSNFETLAVVFNSSSRFARLQGIHYTLAGKNLYMRFSCSTGDAMGMNMVSKGVQNVLDYLQNDFPDMDVISISGNFCSDKKPAAVNWIEERGKSVVCEATIKGLASSL